MQKNTAPEQSISLSQLVEYQSNEEYFRDHPDDEDSFYDDMAQYYCASDEIIDYPEDW